MQSYSLRPRAHNRLIPDRLSHLANGNFVTRTPYAVLSGVLITTCIITLFYHAMFAYMCITFMSCLPLSMLQRRPVVALIYGYVMLC